MFQVPLLKDKIGRIWGVSTHAHNMCVVFYFPGPGHHLCTTHNHLLLLILSPLHRWEKWGFKRLGHMPNEDLNPGMTCYSGLCFKHVSAFSVSHPDMHVARHQRAQLFWKEVWASICLLPALTCVTASTNGHFWEPTHGMGSPQLIKSNHTPSIQESTSVCK